MRSPLRTVAGTLVAVLVFAGCAGGPDASGTESDASDAGGQGPVGRTALGTTAAAAAGMIRGQVVDEEMQPVAYASVEVADLTVLLLTDDAGSFEFTDVPPGTYRLVADKTGYIGNSKALEVEAGKTAEHTFILAKVPPSTAHLQSHNHVAYRDLDQYYLTLTLGILGREDLSCQGCVWHITADEPPVNVLVEVFGRHGVANAYRNDREYLHVRNNETGDQIGYQYADLPLRELITAEDLGGAQDFEIEIICDNVWFCVQEQRSVWVTFAYQMRIPEDFTAGPTE